MPFKCQSIDVEATQYTSHTIDNFRCVRCNTQQMTDNQSAAVADTVDGVGDDDG